jgi:hypothetical protein
MTHIDASPTPNYETNQIFFCILQEEHLTSLEKQKPFLFNTRFATVILISDSD